MPPAVAAISHHSLRYVGYHGWSDSSPYSGCTEALSNTLNLVLVTGDERLRRGEIKSECMARRNNKEVAMASSHDMERDDEGLWLGKPTTFSCFLLSPFLILLQLLANGLEGGGLL